MAALVILSLLSACSKNSDNSSTPSNDVDPRNATGEPPHRKGRALVKELPAGVEGVELTDGGLRVLKGYEVVHDSDSTFSIARVSTGRPGPTGTSGSCKCTSGTGKCKDGGATIIVCVPADTTCTTCGLALTVGGVSTPIFIY
ncbi:MAG TPA: hypothetical protein VFP58_07850 [Candidatus Eisenbacteria bacterium]|nr:hypothetical protein [Candidatus Eisenbacteria bacterium]